MNEVSDNRTFGSVMNDLIDTDEADRGCNNQDACGNPKPKPAPIGGCANEKGRTSATPTGFTSPLGDFAQATSPQVAGLTASSTSASADFGNVFDQAVAVQGKAEQRPMMERALMPMTYVGGDLMSFSDDGWTPIEVIVDSGACETVMPRNMCSHINIVPSRQSAAGGPVRSG